MRFKTIVLCVSLFLAHTFLFGQSFPAKPNKLVNDYTQTLSANEISQLENKLVAFDDSTSTQIAVVLVSSLEGYDVADYAVRLAESWGVGGSKNNNGVMLLVSLGDRKVTIQTGYGVEGALPDAIARRIIENEIKPNFKSGDYFAGLSAGTDAIIAYTKGEYKADTAKRGKRAEGGSATGFVIIIIVIIILIILRKGGGGGSQVIGGRGSASPFWWMLLGSQLGRGSHHGGGFGGFSGRSGGFGGGGGGFGGFGGGSFGGGGASGSW